MLKSLQIVRRIDGKDLAAPQGFEPRYADPESAVLPLNEGAAKFDCALILWVDATLVNFAWPEPRAVSFLAKI